MGLVSRNNQVTSRAFALRRSVVETNSEGGTRGITRDAREVVRASADGVQAVSAVRTDGTVK